MVWYRWVSAQVWAARTRLGGERGASLVEYALLLALIAMVCIVALTFLGDDLSSKYSTVGSAVQN